MSLFPEPSTAEKVASVDKLRQEAREKVAIADRARDERARFYWAQEAERLTKLRGNVINQSQVELML